MRLTVSDIRLSGVTAAIPQAKLNLSELAALYGELEVRRISASTGIHAVRVAGHLSTGDLCEAAARHLMTHLGIEAGSIDGIVVVTQTPDDWMPGVASSLQARLGIGLNCVAIDLVHGCSGFVQGLLQASMLIKAGCSRVLVCAGDVTTKLLKPRDRQSQMVFGDAVGAALVEPGVDAMHFLFETDGTGRSHLTTKMKYACEPGKAAEILHLEMDGSEVMKFALSRVPKVMNAIMDGCGLRNQDVDMVLCHQANEFMVNYLRKLTGFDVGRMPVGMCDSGNTGPASIPLLVANLHEQTERKWKTVLMCGFGVGLSVAALVLSMDETMRIAPVEVA